MKQILLTEPNKYIDMQYKGLISVYKSYYNTFNYNKFLIEYNKIGKNPFLSDKQKRILKMYIRKSIRIRCIVRKFCTKLIYTTRNKKDSINEFSLDLQSPISPTDPTIIYLYSGLNKWGFTCKEINKLFLIGIKNYNMIDPLPILFSNPYSGEQISKQSALHIFLQLRQKIHNYSGHTIHHLVELFAKEYFEETRFIFFNYFTLQRMAVNEFIKTASRRELLDILESIKNKSIISKNILESNTLCESLIRTVLKRELLDIPQNLKNFDNALLYCENSLLNIDVATNKKSKARIRRENRRKKERQKKRRSRRIYTNTPDNSEPEQTEQLTNTEQEINNEIRNAINIDDLQKDMEIEIILDPHQDITNADNTNIIFTGTITIS
tara:strand:+ start:6078 stop:7220 length:1143 start_codon:yes stop_codon:yes gene_type:complete